MVLVHRKCLGCGKWLEYHKTEITPNNINPDDPSVGRYRGMYCGDCAQSHRWDARYYHLCPNCNCYFKTTDPKEIYCCEECKQGKKFAYNGYNKKNCRHNLENYDLGLPRFKIPKQPKRAYED